MRKLAIILALTLPLSACVHIAYIGDYHKTDSGMWKEAQGKWSPTGELLCPTRDPCRVPGHAPGGGGQEE